MRAFIFPGQGSQTVGMGKAFAEAFASAREVFDEVDDALSQRLSRLMWEGPESDLVLTENAQPAIMTASMAVIRVLEREGGLDLGKHARLVAGHSSIRTALRNRVIIQATRERKEDGVRRSSFS